MRFDAGAGFTPAPEDDPLPDLSSVPSETLKALAFHVNGLKAANGAARAVLASAAGRPRGPETVRALAATRRRVDDWTRVLLQLAVQARLYDPETQAPEQGVERARRLVALREAAGHLEAARTRRLARQPQPALRRAGS